LSDLHPKLILHGGAGNIVLPLERIDRIRRSLQKITTETYEYLCGTDARSAVLFGIRRLEDDPLFNAGTGSKLQRDGRARMSAAIMDSVRRRFSGVINVENIQHPIDLADLLASEKYRVIAGSFATQYAHDRGIPYYDPVTEERKSEFRFKRSGQTGTVGLVALDAAGMICAGISTGGTGMEIEGRVSDCPTVAGNYVSGNAGVSMTGIGEHIVDLAAASRIISWADVNIPLRDSISKILELGNIQKAQFGVIGIDRFGNLGWGKTTQFLYHAMHDGLNVTLFNE